MRMSELTFYWHDYETFGRFPRRDRSRIWALSYSDIIPWNCTSS